MYFLIIRNSSKKLISCYYRSRWLKVLFFWWSRSGWTYLTSVITKVISLLLPKHTLEELKDTTPPMGVLHHSLWDNGPLGTNIYILPRHFVYGKDDEFVKSCQKFLVKTPAPQIFHRRPAISGAEYIFLLKSCSAVKYLFYSMLSAEYLSSNKITFGKCVSWTLTLN